MPAIRWDIEVEAGSFEPSYLTLLSPTTGTPLDLTAGYSVRMKVVAEHGGMLLDLDDTSGVWLRSNNGRLYFQPPSEMSTLWDFTYGLHQIELEHPSGETVRIAYGKFVVIPEYIDT